MSENTAEYNAGYESARNGVPDTECPYPRDTKQEEDWVTGWINYHRDNPPPTKKKGCGCGR